MEPQNPNELFPERYDYEFFRDDTYDYIQRENTTCECGLVDGPIQTISFPRGASPERCLKELRGLQEIHGERSDDWIDDHYPDPSEALLAWDARTKRFAEAEEKDIYLVFCDDCEALEQPINKSHWAEIHDEWNVLANWLDGNPEFTAVWDRRKIPYAEAVKRIGEMKPLPPPEPKTYTFNPAYKETISRLLPQIVPIENEDEAPYKLVMEQKAIKTFLARSFANLAAHKLMLLMSGGVAGYKPPYVNVHDSNLIFQQCQYDNWQHWYEFLKKHCQIGEWDGRYESFPKAYWDLSQDSDFAQSEQKIFPISMTYYDSHASGY